MGGRKPDDIRISLNHTKTIMMATGILLADDQAMVRQGWELLVLHVRAAVMLSSHRGVQSR